MRHVSGKINVFDALDKKQWNSKCTGNKRKHPGSYALHRFHHDVQLTRKRFFRRQNQTDKIRTRNSGDLSEFAVTLQDSK